MIFAAGKGTRLMPLTETLPKALVKIKGITLLEHVIQHLKKYHVEEIIINIHYLAEQITEFLEASQYFGLSVHFSDERDLLLDTGGGLKKAAGFFGKNEDFIAYNVDILSDIDLNSMMTKHKESGNLATLAVRSRKTSRYFLFDNEMQLCGWENTHTSQRILSRKTPHNLTSYAFSGIHIINASIFDLIHETGVFSMTQVYTNLCKNSQIKGFVHNDSQWYDIGKHDSIIEAEKYYKFI